MAIIKVVDKHKRVIKNAQNFAYLIKLSLVVITLSVIAYEFLTSVFYDFIKNI